MCQALCQTLPQALSHLILITTLEIGLFVFFNCPYFTYEEGKAQRGEVTCSKSHSQETMELGLEIRSF